MAHTELMQVTFSGYCWRCGVRRFNEVCLEWPVPKDWLVRAITRLEGRGWCFVDGTSEHTARAYCKQCVEATEG
jgi:hypothetical protein